MKSLIVLMMVLLSSGAQARGLNESEIKSCEELAYVPNIFAFEERRNAAQEFCSKTTTEHMRCIRSLYDPSAGYFSYERDFYRASELCESSTPDEIATAKDIYAPNTRWTYVDSLESALALSRRYGDRCIKKAKYVTERGDYSLNEALLESCSSSKR